MKKAAIYVRVSSQEQKLHGLSVDSQIEALQQYCADNGITIYKLYNDAGISARKTYKKRPALLQLLDDAQKGSFDIVLFTKLDRWFRSVSDYYEVQKVLDDKKIPWRAIWEDYETETSAGVFKVNIMLAVAQSEADRTSERIKAVISYKQDRGDYIGKAPLGYYLKGRDIYKDPELKDTFETLFETYSATLSTRKTLDAVAGKGLRLDNSHLLKILHNPAYCGECRNGYKCDPYITREQFDFFQQQIKLRNVSRTRTDKVYLFSGIVRCGCCGRTLAGKALLKYKKTNTRYKAYRCVRGRYPCPPTTIAESKLEAYLLEHLDKLIGDYNIANSYEIKAELIIDNAKRKKALQGKLERLKWLFSEGDISPEEYRTKRDEIKKELLTIEAEAPQSIDLPDNWREVYDSLDDLHKKSFWRSIIDKIVVTPETKACPVVIFR